MSQKEDLAIELILKIILLVTKKNQNPNLLFVDNLFLLFPSLVVSVGEAAILKVGDEALVSSGGQSNLERHYLKPQILPQTGEHDAEDEVDEL